MKIALIGTGKMGQAVAEKALAAGHEIVLKVNAQNLHEATREQLSRAEVAIEFTRPEAAVNNLYRCLEAGLPVVCGTTGWHDRFESVKQRFLAQQGALLFASNFSIGVNMLFQLNRELAGWMNDFPDYRPHMEEVHHTRKLDAPSGTAVTLATDILQQHPATGSWKLREPDEATERHELPIHARREGDVVGIHTVNWASPTDVISIRHEAFSRDGFATGALIAAAWIRDKKGVFGMADLLFSKQKR